MKLSRKFIIIVVISVLVVGAFAFAILNGVFPGSKETHPPCDQLPSVSKVNKALENHQDFVKDIEELGDGVQVHLGKPCDNDKSRGLVEVNYNSKNEHNKISDSLENNKGIGVPIYLVKH